MRRLRSGRVRLAIAAVATGLLAFAVLAPAEADESFTPGSGAATANTFVFNIPYSGANIGLGVGEARTTYFENNATAEAQTVNPGFLNLAKILRVCDTTFPVPLPEPTQANTKHTGAAEAEEKSAPQGGFGAGYEKAEATPGSAGRSESSGLSIAVPGLTSILRVDGGVSVAESKVDPARQTRTSTADVSIGSVSILGGLVRLDGLHWHLEQIVTGPDSRSHTVEKTSTFAMGNATVGLSNYPAGSEIGTVVTAINNFTGPFGLQLLLPEMKPYGEHGFEITPFTVRIGGNTIFGPVIYKLLSGDDLSLLNIFNNVGQYIFDAEDCNQLGGLFKSSPELNSMYNTFGVVAPILINAVAAAFGGGASLDVSLGGARTSVDDTYFPARSAPPIPSRPPLPPIDVAGAGGTQAGGTAARPATSGTTGTPGQPVSAAAPQMVSTTGPTTCGTTSPVGKPGCWKGAAPIAAGLAGAVTLGLLVGDEIYRRRRLAALATQVVSV